MAARSRHAKSDRGGGRRSDWLVGDVDRSDPARDVICAAVRFACYLRLRLLVAYFGDASQVDAE